MLICISKCKFISTSWYQQKSMQLHVIQRSLNRLKRVELYIYFNIFQTRDFNFLYFNTFVFNIFQYVDFYFQRISTNLFQLVSTYFDALFQRYFNHILGLIALKYAWILQRYFDARFHWWKALPTRGPDLRRSAALPMP